MWGKGGSMHLADFSVGSIGETSIVGSGMPVATGAALTSKLQRTGKISLCFFGDGASNEGTFHESLNLAAIWELPVIFLCENNLYAAATPMFATTSVEDIAARGAAYNIPGKIVDGQDVLAVYEVVSEAVVRAREGIGPTLIEAKTYRYRDHAVNMGNLGAVDLGGRSDKEVEYWLSRDPIELFAKVLANQYEVAASVQEKIRKDVRREVEEAHEFATASPFPKPSAAFTDVYSEAV
ncbi:thiamine pyrophosphate-dependent dehydrogenase E1 component subunit alpha [Kineobactrum salinum]|uniref:thiamine pyrophosphate-dependent dehydrogenase E1 component subunit alpha n=1 Tax=Kineobactrum salinum TaxID=2708301 RepID=UPI0022B2A55C|nr:thiamine pyrophosphate-dependent dehydrogenase E1 component subunit alpha [Kineobactrum salinum]